MGCASAPLGWRARVLRNVLTPTSPGTGRGPAPRVLVRDRFSCGALATGRIGLGSLGSASRHRGGAEPGRGASASIAAVATHVRHFLWRRRRPRKLRHLRGQRRRRRRQAAADARWFIKEAGPVGVRAQVRGRGHHGRASIRVPIPVAALHTIPRRSPPSPSCQKRSSTSSTCASSRNGSCGTTSRAPGCPTASRCGARRVKKSSSHGEKPS
jgi:hypothetical protein